MLLLPTSTVSISRTAATMFFAVIVAVVVVTTIPSSCQAFILRHHHPAGSSPRRPVSASVNFGLSSWFSTTTSLQSSTKSDSDISSKKSSSTAGFRPQGSGRPNPVPPRTGAPQQQPPEAPPPIRKKTLYDILGAQPTETRAQLKQRYVQLARISHPDAIGQNNNNNGDRDESSDSSSSSPPPPEFTEIAAAWRILADPKQRKRYDRSLQAEAFAENVGNWADDFTRQTIAPALTNWAMPFLRRTTATTLAGVTAAAQVASASSSSSSSSSTTASGGSSSSSGGSRAAFETAMDAARRAGRYVDGLEYLEKSQALEERAMAEQEQANQLKLELQQIIDRRLTMAIRTPGSGLTSAEATVILQDYNQTIASPPGSTTDAPSSERTTSSIFTFGGYDFGRSKSAPSSVQAEIEALEQIEKTFVETQVADTKAQSAYQECVQEQLTCLRILRKAEKAELKARLAWEEAQKAVDNCTVALEETSRTLTQAKVESKKSDYEMERQSISLAQQSEKVRTALREKEKVVRQARRHAAEMKTASSTTTTNGAADDDHSNDDNGDIDDDVDFLLNGNRGNQHQSIATSVTGGDGEEQKSEKPQQQQQQQQRGIRYEYNLQEEEYLDSISEEESPQRYQELSDLRAQERLLAETSARMEEMATKMMEKALELRQQAQAIEDDRES